MDRDAGGGGGAMTAFEAVIALIKKKYYREASECVKMVMEAYPEVDLSLKEYGFCLLVISETLHYGNIILPNCGDDAFDYYSVLHLPPSSTCREVEDRFYQLREQLFQLKNTGFHAVTLAESLLSLAKSNLCQRFIRYDFDTKRKECVFLDWPLTRSNSKPTTTCSLEESYLDWKPPVYHVDAIENIKSRNEQKMVTLFAHLHDDKKEREKEKEVGVGVEEEEEEEEEEESDDDDDDEEEEEDEEDEDEDASLSPELRILKRKVFDEMPQNPHYTPLEKYSGQVREGMILGLEVAFTKVCEEIRNLVDAQSFLHELDSFNEQLSQFKDMGYNVEKVRGRIDILESIAKHEQTSSAAAKKFQNEVRDREDKVIILQKRISNLQTEIEESKPKIQTFKKDSIDAVAKFAATAKSKWV